VTVWRMAWLSVCCATAMRTGAEAAYILAWSPVDAELSARVMMAQRWVNSVSVLFTATWMGLLVLSWTTIEQQLRRQPLPINMWARASMLKRPLAVLILSLGMAVGVVWARG